MYMCAQEDRGRAGQSWAELGRALSDAKFKVVINVHHTVVIKRVIFVHLGNIS